MRNWLNICLEVGPYLVIVLLAALNIEGSSKLHDAEQRFTLSEARAQALERTRYGWIDSAYRCKLRSTRKKKGKNRHGN